MSYLLGTQALMDSAQGVSGSPIDNWARTIGDSREEVLVSAASFMTFKAAVLNAPVNVRNFWHENYLRTRNWFSRKNLLLPVEINVAERAAGLQHKQLSDNSGRPLATSQLLVMATALELNLVLVDVPLEAHHTLTTQESLRTLYPPGYTA